MNIQGLFHRYDPIQKQIGLISIGQRQRKHKVIVNRDTNKIYIVLNKDKKIYDSDRFAKRSSDEDEEPGIDVD